MDNIKNRRKKGGEKKCRKTIKSHKSNVNNNITFPNNIDTTTIKFNFINQA